MPPYLKLDGLLHKPNAENILDLNSIALDAMILSIPQTYVDIATHLTFFHVGVGDIQIFEGALELLHGQLTVFGMVYVWHSDNLEEWHAGTIVVD